MPPPMDADEEAPISEAPATVDWERAAKQVKNLIGPTPGAVEHRLDPVADEAELQALTRELGAIGALDERPDRTTDAVGVQLSDDRPVAVRTTLARARALRFRLALLQAWSSEPPKPADPSGQGRALHLDLAIEAMLLVTLADGAPAIFGPASPLPVVGLMVDTFRALRPELPRTALRDRGAAAIARMTIVGWRSALEAVTRSATATPIEARRLTLELSAHTALVPAIDEHRLGALRDLERAMSLPTGSVAPAIELARRQLAAKHQTRSRAR